MNLQTFRRKDSHLFSGRITTEAEFSSEKSGSFLKSTWHHVPELVTCHLVHDQGQNVFLSELLTPWHNCQWNPISMEPRTSLVCSQETSIRLYPEINESNWHLHIMLFNHSMHSGYNAYMYIYIYIYIYNCICTYIRIYIYIYIQVTWFCETHLL
jgi:hypothetical protein